MLFVFASGILDINRGLTMETDQVLEEPASHTQTQATNAAPLAFDPAAYRHFLDDCDWTKPQKDAFIAALWEIVSSFADLGFGRDPIQQAMDVRKARVSVPPAKLKVLSCSQAFNRQTIQEAATVQERAAGKKDS